MRRSIARSGIVLVANAFHGGTGARRAARGARCAARTRQPTVALTARGAPCSHTGLHVRAVTCALSAVVRAVGHEVRVGVGPVPVYAVLPVWKAVQALANEFLFVQRTPAPCCTARNTGIGGTLGPWAGLFLLRWSNPDPY